MELYRLDCATVHAFELWLLLIDLQLRRGVTTNEHRTAFFQLFVMDAAEPSFLFLLDVSEADEYVLEILLHMERN